MFWDQLAISDMLIWIAVFWCLCGIPGASVGSIKNAGKQGFLLGSLLGPLGVIAAFALDRRPKCRACQRRIENHELCFDSQSGSSGGTLCSDCGGNDLSIEQTGSHRPYRESTGQNIRSCPDCNGKVSRRVQTCPHCGCPLDQSA